MNNAKQQNEGNFVRNAVIGIVAVLAIGFLVTAFASAAPPAPAAVQEEPGFLDRMRASISSIGEPDQEEIDEIVAKYAKETHAAGVQARTARDAAVRDAAVAAQAKANYTRSLQSLRNCVNAATNR